MSESGSKVGVLGLGVMGAGIAKSIGNAGFPLLVFDVAEAACAPFREAGTTVSASVDGVIEQADVIVSCLPSIEISRNVVATIASIGRPAVFVETGTVGTLAIREFDQTLSSKGIALVDGPVSGGGPRASAGTLTSILAGSPEAVDLARPIVAGYSEKIHVVADEPGPAQTIKLINNMLSAVGMIAAFEGFVMGAKAGLDPEMMLEVINSSTGRNSATEDKIPRFVLTRKFGGHITTGLKDLGLYRAEASELEVPTWMGPKALEVYEAACAGGFDKETFRIIQFMEQLAGITVEKCVGSAKETVE